MTQSAEQTAAQRPAHLWRPGQSGNPRGSESKAARKARIAAIIAEWVAPHGGTAAFGAAELALLNRAAELSLLRPRNPLDGIRAANTVARILALLGLVDGRRKREPVHVPLRERLAAEIAVNESRQPPAGSVGPARGLPEAIDHG